MSATRWPRAVDAAGPGRQRSALIIECAIAPVPVGAGGGLTGCPRSSGNRGRRHAAHRGGFRSTLRPSHVRATPPCRRPASTGCGCASPRSGGAVEHDGRTGWCLTWAPSPPLLGTEPAIEVVAKAGERL